MISIDILLYDLDLRLNRLASGRHQSIPIEDKILALNDAQILLVKQKTGINNIYKSGLESFAKRIDDLQLLMVKDHKLDIVFTTTTTYVAPLLSLSNYQFYVTSYILAQKGSCKDQPVTVNLIGHSDVQTWISNKHLCPSFEYQETIATLAENTLTIYTDGTFEPTELRLTYLRYPKKVDVPGYIHFDESPSVLMNCELPEYLKDELIDIAVMNIAANTENLNVIQLTKERIQRNE